MVAGSTTSHKEQSVTDERSERSHRDHDRQGDESLLDETFTGEPTHFPSCPSPFEVDI